MAILNIPPEVYHDNLVHEKHGVSDFEIRHQLGNANPMKVVADAIKEISKINPNINITINVNGQTENDSGNKETKPPMIKVEANKI